MINLPAPILGGYLWESVGVYPLFELGGIVGLSAILLVLLIKEPKKRQK